MFVHFILSFSVSFYWSFLLTISALVFSHFYFSHHSHWIILCWRIFPSEYLNSTDKEQRTKSTHTSLQALVQSVLLFAIILSSYWFRIPSPLIPVLKSNSCGSLDTFSLHQAIWWTFRCINVQKWSFYGINWINRKIYYAARHLNARLSFWKFANTIIPPW